MCFVNDDGVRYEDIKIEELDLTWRAKRALKEYELKTVYDTLLYFQGDYALIGYAKGYSDITVEEVKNYFEKNFDVAEFYEHEEAIRLYDLSFFARRRLISVQVRTRKEYEMFNLEDAQTSYGRRLTKEICQEMGRHGIYPGKINVWGDIYQLCLPEKLEEELVAWGISRIPRLGSI